MATSRFVQITDKEINEIKINSILKNTKDPTKFGVKLFQGIYFFYYNVNNILGAPIISRKNITLAYKDMENCFLYSLECVKILKQLFASGSVIFGEYSP